MRHTWWQRLGLWLSIFGILIFTACGSPTTVAVVPPTATTDTSTSVSTTVRVAKSAGFALDYRVTSQWGNGFTAEVTIHNTSPDPIPAWTLNWTFPQDPTQITNLWNGTVSQTSTQVTVSNLSHNSVIPAGGSVNFGFQASYPGGDLTTPVAFIFNGQPLAQPTPTPASLACLVDYTVSSSWNEGFVANLTIRNLGGSVTGWELGFDFPVDGVNITNLWNGSLNQTGRTVQVTNLEWNKTIPANGTASVGFQAAHSGGSVTPTGFRLNGVPCTGQPATPIPSPSPEPSTSPIPANSIVILNAEVVDGTPYTIGQTIELNAAARNANNQDISTQIQWFNAEGQTLGTGSRLTYQAEAVIAETITAQIQISGIRQEAKVSFNVSGASVTLQKHVKPLPDEISTAIVRWDPEAKLLKLSKVNALPTIYVNDVIMGAKYRLPPMRVQNIKDLGDALELKIEGVYPDAVFKHAVVDQWEFKLVDPNGNLIDPVGNGAGRANYACRGFGDITFNPNPIRIADITSEETVSILDPWGLFTRGLRTLSGTASLDFKASGGFCPVIEFPRFEFDENSPNGIKKFSLGYGLESIQASASLVFNGSASISDTYTRELNSFNFSNELNVPTGMFLGVIPTAATVTLVYDFGAEVRVNPSLEISANNYEWGLSYTGGRLLYGIQYENGQWTNQPQVELGQISPIREGNINASGSVGLSLVPQAKNIGLFGGISIANINLKIVGVQFPTIGVRFYVNGTASTMGTDLQVLKPQVNSEYSPTDALQLAAQVNSASVELGSSWGVDFEVGENIEIETICEGEEIFDQNLTSQIYRQDTIFTSSQKNCDIQEFKKWINENTIISNKTRPGNSDLKSRIYEYDVCGSKSYTVFTDNRQINIKADGIIESECRVAECKYSSCKDFHFRAKTGANDEFNRYSKIVSDPNTPLVGLTVYTNRSPDEPAYQWLRSALNLFGLETPKGEVITRRN